MPEIVVRFGDKIIQRHAAEKPRISIGRTADNDIVLDNKAVSRKHAVIEFNGNSAVVIDNDSMNGTFVNNRKIAEEILKDSDVIRKFDLEFHQEDQSLLVGEAALDGTMVLETKRQRDLIKRNKGSKLSVPKLSGSLLISEDNNVKYLIDGVMTIGKSGSAAIRAKGFFTSNIQAKVICNNDRHMIVNIGRKSKLQVNGHSVDVQVLKNDDIIKVGKSYYRYLQGN